MFVHSLSETWWSGIIRSTSPSLSWWRRTQPSRSTGAGSVSSTVRTARGSSSSVTIWTFDLPERRDEESSDRGCRQPEGPHRNVCVFVVCGRCALNQRTSVRGEVRVIPSAQQSVEMFLGGFLSLKLSMNTLCLKLVWFTVDFGSLCEGKY